ncbi:type I restriction-modification system subunit M [Leekyejoonella antrihumi]|uniref:type I restriction-modification system subunit M n=1 Tax=Leekyejoonella antrihumi TaxID=1660198 RepID=UPI001FE6F98D|nr:class I SAM-dependent DNA methyltransferase [Leekyejoonella antrihumi]
MPPKKKPSDQAPSTVKELKDTLWKAADKLRGSMDASQYKDVILGLVFLKYVSDAFEERREQIEAELVADGWAADQIAEEQDDLDEYVGHGVFWVAPQARWGYLAEHGKGLPAAAGEPAKSIGDLVDDAMDLLMGSNQSLRGTLPRLYGRDNVDQRRLGELMDLFNGARFTGQGATKARDLLGEVYEYFLEKFARAEGKRGGEFYTPASVVRVLVEVLEPSHGRVYDPCCGSGGMFVQTEKFLESHGEEASDIAVYGQENNERTWRMAQMNLAIHGIDTQGLGARWGDTFARDIHPDLQADYVMANPPFNIKDWSRNEDDSRWRFGVPPKGNANYAWMQHIISKLAPGGTAGVVMANGSMSSNSSGEGDIRANLVEADLVSCMVALPTQLFRSTGIPVCVWFFAKDKSAGAKGSIDRTGQVLFIDARELGYMVDRAERALSDEDIAKIAATYHLWRGTASHTRLVEPGEREARARVETPGDEHANSTTSVPARTGGPATRTNQVSSQGFDTGSASSALLNPAARTPARPISPASGRYPLSAPPAPQPAPVGDATSPLDGLTTPTAPHRLVEPGDGPYRLVEPGDGPYRLVEPGDGPYRLVEPGEERARVETPGDTHPDPTTAYVDIPGFCKSATLAEIKEAGYALTPGRYVGAPELEDDGEPIDQKIERLSKELFEAMDESARLDAVVREQLGRLA